MNKHRSRYQETVKLRTLWILCAALLIVAPLEVGYSSYLETVDNGVGVCIHLEDVNNETIPHLLNLGVSWVRIDWGAPWDKMRDFSQDLQDAGIKLLVIIDHKTFGYKVPTLEEWTQRITELIYSGNLSNVDAVEIWNEPNSNFTESLLPPETYYEMLKIAYAVIKNYTAIPVVFAGVSPNVPDWKSYLTTVFAHPDIANYFDCMGIHLYDDMEKSQEHLQFVKSLTSKPIWLTETGKPTPPLDESRTEAGQAAYVHSMYDTFGSLVDKIFIYELRDGQGNTLPLEENYFGLLTRDGAKKPAYSEVWNINRGEAGIKVGIYYYPWYHANWVVNHPNCVDIPYLGEYSSSNLTVILQHLNWFEDLGIDFVIFSWWGKDSPSDNNTKLIVSQMAENYTNLQFFIMVEPFAKEWNATYNPWPEAYNASGRSYNFSVIYDYFYNTYVGPFNSSCFCLDGQPVIGFYHGPDENFSKKTVPNDGRFSRRLIGYKLTSGDDWEYQVPNATLSSQPICRDGEISVCPRYCANNQSIDADYTQGLYDEQWGKILNETKQGDVKIVTIISWNEFSERTQIEPTNDTTSAFKHNPFYLFNKTQGYIETLSTTIDEFPTSTIAIVVAFVVIILGIMLIKFKRLQSRKARP